MYRYYFQNEQIIAEKIGNKLIKFYYDGTGVCGFNYNGTDYYYQKNIQGDILKIFNGNGTLYAEYGYDAWGKCTIKTNVSGIAAINPFRYRGYYYDEEISLYYLNARYYDPEIGRFISADSIAYLEPQTIGGFNLYAYCLNNPLMYTDPDGTYVHIIIGAGIGFIVGFIGQLISDALSSEWSTWQDYVGSMIGGAIGGAATALTGNVLAGAAIGSLAADTITLGLNLISGKEYRSPLEILNDTAINMVISSVLATAGPAVIGLRNAGKSVLKPLLKETTEITLQTVLYNIGEESTNSGIQSIFVFLLGKLNRLIFLGKR